MTILSWQQSRLQGLTPESVHEVLALRAEVFVVEQRCAFLDPDDLDQHSWHLLGRKEGALVAYLRIIDAGRKYAEPAIARVVTKPSERGVGLGERLMEEGIARARVLWPDQPIRIGAQERLEVFYRRLGFQPSGPSYIEDGIAHVEMLLESQPRVLKSTMGQRA